ncbi:MAG: hypothetical protein E7551_09240 [Ruminococcaceae bacterium]|nr:hypothetical protein [Oscillospiraceae bacterium]
MKKIILKAMSLFLCITLLFVLSPKAIATTYTALEFNEKLNEVKTLYPHGSQKYEWKVNGTVVGWECHGYARWISYYIWGTDFANGEGEGWVRYNSTSTKTPIDKLVPGDILRYRTAANKSSNHSIFVTAIEGDTVYFTDCNSDGASTIKWERTTTKSYLAEHLKMQLAGRDYVEYGYIAHYSKNTLTENKRLTLSYNANGGKLNLEATKTIQYTVEDDSGINMRSGAGTSYGVLTALPKGTVFTVTETATDSKYTWGKTTYNGKTGWCVISREWTSKTEVTTPPKYYINSDGNIYISDTQKAFTESFVFGTEHTSGFSNPTEFGLVREGYTFLGWSKTQNSDTFYKYTESFTPETLFPEANGKDYAATLYAVWQSNKTLTGIEVVSLPTKTKYLLNATLSSSGLKIKLKYSNNTEEIITKGFTLSGFDSKTVGEKTVTVSYEGKTATFTLLVEDLKTGDLNKDFNIDLVDVTILAQYVANWEIECDQTALDVNGDSSINLLDIVHLSQYVAGWEDIVIK